MSSDPRPYAYGLLGAAAATALGLLGYLTYQAHQARQLARLQAFAGTLILESQDGFDAIDPDAPFEEIEDCCVYCGAAYPSEKVDDETFSDAALEARHTWCMWSYGDARVPVLACCDLHMELYAAMGRPEHPAE